METRRPTVDIISNTTMMYKLSLHRRRRTKEKDWHRRIKSSVLKYYLPSSNLLLLSLFFLNRQPICKKGEPFPPPIGRANASSVSLLDRPIPSPQIFLFLLQVPFLNSTIQSINKVSLLFVIHHFSLVQPPSKSQISTCYLVLPVARPV